VRRHVVSFWSNVAWQEETECKDNGKYGNLKDGRNAVGINEIIRIGELELIGENIANFLLHCELSGICARGID
jgi:hypothetical protein